MKNLVHSVKAKALAGAAILGCTAMSTYADLVTYDSAGATPQDQVTFDTSALTTWLTDGLVAGILVGAILFGIAVGTKYLVKLIRRIGS